MFSKFNPNLCFRNMRPISCRHYSEKVMDHYNNPRNVGSLDRKDPNVGTAMVGSAACGDLVKLQINVQESTGKIVDVKFKGFGCGSLLASSSYATELIKNKTLEEALQVTNKQISSSLELIAVKNHCSMLAEDAIKAAVADYKNKQANKKQ